MGEETLGRVGSSSTRPTEFDMAITSVLILGAIESDLDTANESVEFEQILQGGYNRTAQSLQEKIWHLHLATQICYHLANEWDHDTAGCSDSSSSSSSSSKEVCKALSDYMMCLLVMQPSLLPTTRANAVSINLEIILKDPHMIIGDERNENMACHYMLESEDVWSTVAEGLKEKEKLKRWEILELMWWRLLADAVDSQQLRQGGEFLTFMLLFNI